MVKPYIDMIQINQIVVIESLGPNDKRLARDMAFDVNLEVMEKPIKAKFELCEGIVSFKALIAELAARTLADQVLPMLHIECHGHEDEGLTFSDGSKLHWTELWDLLRPLNVAMRNRLVVVLATCVSGSSITSVPLSSAAPCYFLIAPTKRIWPDELYSSFKEFYSLLSLGEATKAMTALTNRRYQEGEMLPVSAGQWFSLLMDEYLKAHGDKKGLKASALRLAIKAKADGLPHLDLRYWKRFVKKTLSRRLHEYFDVFFMLDKVPVDRQRFAREQIRLEQMLEQLGYPDAKMQPRPLSTHV